MDLTGISRDLRKVSTDAERALWNRLRSGQLSGLKFRRQQPVGRYVLDFVCFEKRLAVEIDGSQHREAAALDADRVRDGWLKGQGFRVLRFWSNDTLRDPDSVAEAIRLACHPPLTPPIEGGE